MAEQYERSMTLTHALLLLIVLGVLALALSVDVAMLLAWMRRR